MGKRMGSIEFRRSPNVGLTLRSGNLAGLGDFGDFGLRAPDPPSLTGCYK